MHARFADASSLLEQPETNKAAADAIATAITKRRFAIYIYLSKGSHPWANLFLPV
jgi:hypothetical protein